MLICETKNQGDIYVMKLGQSILLMFTVENLISRIKIKTLKINRY